MTVDPRFAHFLNDDFSTIRDVRYTACVDNLFDYEDARAEPTGAEISDFLVQVEAQLEQIFPASATIDVHWDHSQYMTCADWAHGGSHEWRSDKTDDGDEYDWLEDVDPYRDDPHGDGEDWALYVCDQVASEIAANVWPFPDDDDSAPNGWAEVGRCRPIQGVSQNTPSGA